MPSALNSTVLVIGATSGIGRGMAERIHASGRKVIACGRRQERLDALASKHPGLSVQRFDLSKVDTIESQLQEIWTEYPGIDTVIVAAGIQNYGSIHEGQPNSIQEAQEELNTNFLGPVICSRYILPKFLKEKNRRASLIFVGSGLAFVPLAKMPIYCATKIAIHSLAVSLRSDLAGTNVSVVEVIPPYTETELGAAHIGQMMRDFGDLAKFLVPLKLDFFLDETMKGLEEGKAEVAVGTAEPRLNAWRTAFQPFLDRLGTKG